MTDQSVDKNENLEVLEEHCQTEKEDKWLAQLKRLGLAAVGAAALAQDELQQFVNKLVERGELAESESRKWMNDFIERGRHHTQQTQQTVESGIGASLDNIEKVLAKMSIPSKSDLEELSRKVDALSERLESLQKERDPREHEHKGEL